MVGSETLYLGTYPWFAGTFLPFLFGFLIVNDQLHTELPGSAQHKCRKKGTFLHNHRGLSYNVLQQSWKLTEQGP